jgi:hypothetical protein
MYHDLGHLGQQQAYGITAAAAGTTAAVTKGVATALQSTSKALSVIPIVGGIVAGVATILELFHVGEGCGQACIESAQTEQIFEIAADNILAAAKAGMITASQAVAAMQWIQQQGDAQMAQLAQTDSKAKAGQVNMDKVIQDEIKSVAPNTPPIPTDAPTAALDPTKLETSIFIQSGWYAQSRAAGASLALQAIAEVTGVASGTAAAPAAQIAPTTPGAAAGIVSEVESFVSSLTSTELVVGVGIVAALGYFALRKR